MSTPAPSFFSGPVKCPACGQTATLPTISPERLFFLEGDAVKRFAAMPDGSGGELYVIAVQGVAHTITPGYFGLYQQLCASAAQFMAAAA